MVVVLNQYVYKILQNKVLEDLSGDVEFDSSVECNGDFCGLYCVICGILFGKVVIFVVCVYK